MTESDHQRLLGPGEDSAPVASTPTHAFQPCTTPVRGHISIADSPGEPDGASVSVRALKRQVNGEDDQRCALQTETSMSRRRRRMTLKDEMHPLRTCLIVGMPWAAYSIFSTLAHIFCCIRVSLTELLLLLLLPSRADTVFTDVRQAYMESLGISSVVPRFVPGLVTFFLGPILGAASDRSLSKWGRRNVFMVLAAVVMTVFGLLFGAASVLFPDYDGVTNCVLVLLCVGVLLINVRPLLKTKIMRV